MSSRVRTTNEVDSQSKFRPADGRRTAAFSIGRSGWRKTAAKVRLGQVVTQPQPVVDQHSTSTERLARASFNRHENRSGATSAGDYRLEAHTDHPSSSVVVLRRASPGLLLLDTNTRIAESVRDKDIPVDSRHAETVTADDNKSRRKKKKKNLVKLAPLWLWTRPGASLWWWALVGILLPGELLGWKVSGWWSQLGNDTREVAIERSKQKDNTHPPALDTQCAGVWVWRVTRFERVCVYGTVG